MRTNLMRSLMAASALCFAVGAAGCTFNDGIPRMNPYQDIPLIQPFVGDKIPSATFFSNQAAVVDPHCHQVAKETTPSPSRKAAAGFVNGAGSGFAGGTVGSLGNFAINGVRTTPELVLGTGVYTGAAYAFANAMNGANSSDQERHSMANWCKASNVGGYRMATQAEIEEISRTGTSVALERVIQATPSPYAGAANGRPPPLP